MNRILAEIGKQRNKKLELKQVDASSNKFKMRDVSSGGANGLFEGLEVLVIEKITGHDELNDELLNIFKKRTIINKCYVSRTIVFLIFNYAR